VYQLAIQLFLQNFTQSATFTANIDPKTLKFKLFHPTTQKYLCSTEISKECGVENLALAGEDAKNHACNFKLYDEDKEKYFEKKTTCC